MHSWGCNPVTEAHRYFGIPWSQKSENHSNHIRQIKFKTLYCLSDVFILLLCWWRQQIIQNYVAKVKPSFCSVVLRLHRVFFYSNSVCNKCFSFSDFEILILKYLKKIFPVIFPTSKKSVKFCFPFSFSKHYKSKYFRFSLFSSERRWSPYATFVTSFSQRSSANHCQECQ
jgi:hypothetical protein